MGLFGISLPNPLHALSSAAHWVGHEASNVGGFVASHVSDLKYLSPEYDLFEAGKWIAKKLVQHWRTLVTIAVGLVVFTAVVAVIVASGGTATALLTVVAASALSGAASQATQDALADKTPGWDVLTTGVVSGALAAVSFGALRVAEPVLEPLATRFPIVARLANLPDAAAAADKAATATASAVDDAASAGAAAVGHEPSAAVAAAEEDSVPFSDAVLAALKQARPPIGKVISIFTNGNDGPEQKKPDPTATPESCGIIQVFESGPSACVPPGSPLAPIVLPRTEPTTTRARTDNIADRELGM